MEVRETGCGTRETGYGIRAAHATLARGKSTEVAEEMDSYIEFSIFPGETLR